ncbi:GNAT family N-acetyltransferase [Romeria aff. gracilis LEGE 07310]|uniref:GNAT family N-acetyltransferase n=1 Tax=Vasconcelosia minhoensis LEGE 07310 TaxID=915328 RepID=A0A8J7A8M4_9CYAN|nr:GNAT family N-acetyltransferase [Romeria gracilis]MBE9078070.1 GNAT family N-acetyltransferase [Romeria aff. gracilis LEGE 07310]
MTFLACLPLISADLPAVLALDQRCLGGLWTAAGYQREIESPNSTLLVLAAAETAAPLLQRRKGAAAGDALTLVGTGCLWAILEEAHLTILLIDPAYRRQRLGQLLLSLLLRDGQRRQLQRATLEVRVSNCAARQLYEKFGFQTAGRRRRYYADGEDALILWRSGLQSDAFIQQRQQLQTEALRALGQHRWQWLET